MTQKPDATRIAELEADNTRLRRLLDERDASGELRHRLRNTVAMLRIIIRKSAETNRDLDAYVAHLEDRLEALTRAQAAADLQGWINLHDIVADELQYYTASEGERVLLSGPIVSLETRTGQVFALAIHELAVNAVEHGALTNPAGRIEVAWHIATDEVDTPLTFTWEETGLTGVAERSRHGFGTEVLTRTIPYELRADTALVFKPDGLRCTIRFPFPAGMGRVAAS